MPTAGPKDAPGELELVRRFVNTLHVDDGSDTLATTPQLRHWLSENGLLDESSAEADVGEAERLSAVALREAIRDLLLAHTESEPPPAKAAHGSSSGLGSRRKAEPAAAHARGAGGSGPSAGDRLRRDADGRVGAPEGLQERHVPLGVLRSLQEPLGALVRDGRLRQPGEAAHVPAPPQRGRAELTTGQGASPPGPSRSGPRLTADRA